MWELSYNRHLLRGQLKDVRGRIAIQTAATYGTGIPWSYVLEPFVPVPLVRYQGLQI